MSPPGRWPPGGSIPIGAAHTPGHPQPHIRKNSYHSHNQLAVATNPLPRKEKTEAATVNY